MMVISSEKTIWLNSASLSLKILIIRESILLWPMGYVYRVSQKKVPTLENSLHQNNFTDLNIFTS